MDFRNSEWYPDPTCYEALTNIERDERAAAASFRPLVYICSPYAGDVETNVRNARRYCRFAVKRGCIPVAPHLLFPQFLDDGNPREREIGLFSGRVLMDRCREVWVFGGIITSGMAAEISRARRKGQLLRFFTEDLKEARG